MGKAPNRKRNQDGQPEDAHQRIQAEAKKASEAPEAALRNADETPAIASLMESAREAMGAATPTRFVHKGRTYWLRISIGLAGLEIYDSPFTAKPLARGLVSNSDRFGHTPAH